MDIMEKIDMENQMTVLQDATLEEEAQSTKDEVEDLSNSLREIVQDEAVKPKLHCLMMDPDFSMVTVQSEDSGIVWETASSRCSTPWAVEYGSAPPEPCYSLVLSNSGTPSSETAGKIVFIMDEDHMIRRRKKKRNKVPEKVPKQSASEVPSEPERPAMVEVSLPNTRKEQESEVEEIKDPKEEGNQRLFQLLSEGSEILDIIAPPKIFTVDEEESKELVDNLLYLEDAPVIKFKDIIEEAELFGETQTENVQVIIQSVPEPALPSPIKPPQRGATSEDYFEKFTLLDRQVPAGAQPVEGSHEPEITTEQAADESKDKLAVVPKSEVEISIDLVPPSELESEHVDEVFYGGGSDPDRQTMPRHNENTEGDPLKSPLKESGSALFGSQESILTPIFLPEGPPKIIDPNLLEEPKAMAFLYSDLYADAVGTRKKQDDTESLTSEKSFHSQESDVGDRGYLEKFVLKDETPATEVLQLPDDRKAVRVRMWSEDAFGVPRHARDEAGAQDKEDEVTDFFRDSANSSPCEPIELNHVKPEETIQETKTRRVVFQDEAAKVDTRTTEAEDNVFLPPEEDIEIAEAFLPFDISMEPPSVETSWVTVDSKSAIAEYADKTRLAKSTKSEKMKRVKAPKEHLLIRSPQTVKPITPCHKPFLDLTPLLPVEIEEEGHEEMEIKQEKAIVTSVCSPAPKESAGEALDYELITQQEASEYAVPQTDSPRGGEGSDSGGFTMVEYPSQLDNLYDTVEADYEIVDAPVS